jgi:hypothetical protein
VQTLSSTELLAVWERAARLHAIDRALVLLSAALPEVAGAELADWPLGKRNRALAEWLCVSVGPSLAGRTTCSQCGEELEIEFDARALLELEPADPAAEVEVGGHAFRPPSTRDLAHVAGVHDPDDAVAALLEQCRVDDRRDALSLSTDEIAEVGEALALADPLAETRVALRCPECEAEEEETLDLAAFAWTEVESRAKRLLLDVHALATTYGWTESDVLSVSEERRAFYVEAAGW